MRVLEALKERQHSGQFSIEYRWKCADGTYKHFHDREVLLKDAENQPLEFAGTLTDVTELRRAESQLFEARKMDAVGKLTGGVAHDFNNLLAAVIGGLGLIERRAKLDKSQQEILTMTKRAAEQGTELVRRLLAFARRQQLQPDNVEIATLQNSISGLLAHTLGGRVQLEWQLPNGLWQAFADPAQLELALMNLIINARDAMSEGGTILLSAENRVAERGDEELKPGHYVVISVKDSGCGIPAEMIEEVLQPFVTTKDIGKGTGLGLSMVYGFASQSNGAFRLHSEMGVGTKAEIWLPRAAKARKRLEIPAPATEAIKRGRSLKVLVVDDHAEVRTTTVGMLRDLGHKVAEATDGKEALARLDGKQCDLLITDYAMPNLSGTDLIREARKLRPGLPSMIITGYADKEAVGERPNDVAVLSKPFSLERLSEAIGSATANRAQSDAVAVRAR